MLRVLLTTVAVILLKLPFLQSIGGVLLVWIAVKLLADEEADQSCHASGCLKEAIKTIIVADFLMSLDNVLAVAGVARGNIPLLVAGLAISIPIIIFGSQLIMILINRFPFIDYLGAGILGWTAGEMIAGDQKLRPLLHGSLTFLEWLVPLSLTLFVVGCGKWLSIRQEKSVVNETGTK